MRNTRILSVAAALCGMSYGANWLTDGGGPQRTGWQQDEHVLSKNNVKNMRLLWKAKLNTDAHEMHSIFPPLIADRVNTPAGPKQILIEFGIADNIFAIDASNGQTLWQKHFTYGPITEGRPSRVGDPLCPHGATATPIVVPASTAGTYTVYAMAGNGELHSLNVANGEDVKAPFKFGFGNGKSYSLNLWNGVLFTTTSQGCSGNPNQMWAVKLDDPDHKVMTYSPKSGGLWGRSGAAIDSNGVAWAPTGDGVYVKETQTYGNGLVGAKVVGNELKLQDYFIPSNWSWLRKRDLDFQVTPTIFKYKDRELMATASKECRVYLLDTKDAGGEDHQTPLDRTDLLCNEEVNFASAGIWGSMATWQDAKGTRWVLTPFWGPVHSKFKPPVSYGPVKDGAIVAFKVEERNGKPQLIANWMSRDMNRAEPPVIANGVVYAYGNGENTEQAYPDRGLDDQSPLRIKNSTHSVLYALDAETGKELWNSGDQINSFWHFGALSIANGQVYIGAFDGTLYCYGLGK